MPRTPDAFPGSRLDEALILDPVESGSMIEGELRYITGSNEFRMRDGLGEFNPRSSGSLTGSGITETEHETLDTLVHSVEENSYEEVVYFGVPPKRISNVITWTDAGKTTKIREQEYEYTGNRVTLITESQYDAAGTILYAVTESISYVNSFSSRVSNITRIRNDY